VYGVKPAPQAAFWYFIINAMEKLALDIRRRLLLLFTNSPRRRLRHTCIKLYPAPPTQLLRVSVAKRWSVPAGRMATSPSLEQKHSSMRSVELHPPLHKCIEFELMINAKGRPRNRHFDLANFTRPDRRGTRQSGCLMRKV
jgi:hypothetical protein